MRAALLALVLLLATPVLADTPQRNACLGLPAATEIQACLKEQIDAADKEFYITHQTVLAAVREKDAALEAPFRAAQASWNDWRQKECEAVMAYRDVMTAQLCALRLIDERTAYLQSLLKPQDK